MPIWRRYLENGDNTGARERVVQGDGSLSWDHKRGCRSRRYFYRCVRVPDKPHPVKVYLGRGEAAQVAEAQIELARQDRCSTKKAIAAENERMSSVNIMADRMNEGVSRLLQECLLERGYYRRRGEWRLPHVRPKTT